jgi:hypothetical protein
MNKEEVLSQKRMNKLAKKYGVKYWYWVSSNTMKDEEGRIFSVQMVDDIEELFKLGKDKVVNVYAKRYPKMGGFITSDDKQSF